ncbi:hypothetical protein JXA12_02470 [Candidatus Woesearchaeota archaeon]|nr:hypothetical protein [Candidatus Woesearchaeota archaeon]
MIDLPLPAIIDKIAEEKGLSEEAVKERIKKKLDELSGLISDEGAAHIIANELGVKLYEPGKPLSVDQLRPGMRNIEIVGKARQVYEIREFATERRSGKVANFLLTDQTGTTRVVLWNEQADKLHELKAGDVIKIKGGYARSNNDRVELHLGTEAKLYVNPEGVEVDVDIESSPRPAAMTKRIADLSSEDQNVTVVATVVQVFDPRFFAVCKECNSRVKEEDGGFVCPTHGAVQPAYNYVMNLYLDDGSDNIRCVLWREQVDQLLGETSEELAKYKDDPAAFEQHKTDLLGIILKVRGRVNQNETFGRLELVAYETTKDVDPEKELADLKAQADAPPAKEKKTVTEEREVVAEVEDGKVKRFKEKEEVTAEAPEKKAKGADEVFTLDDIEDLDD